MARRKRGKKSSPTIGGHIGKGAAIGALAGGGVNAAVGANLGRAMAKGAGLGAGGQALSGLGLGAAGALGGALRGGVVGGALGAATYGGKKLVGKKNRRRGRFSSPANASVAEFSTIAEALEEVEIDEDADPIQVEQELFSLVSNNIDAAEDSGLIDEAEAAELRADLIEENRARLEDLLGVDSDDEEYDEEEYDDEEYDDEEHYFDGTSLATFSTGAGFADGLLSIGEALGYESVEDYALDLADTMGLSDEQAVGLLTGDIVPDEEVFDYLADTLGLDDELYEELGVLADLERDAIDEDEYAEEEEEEEAVTYSRYQDRRVQDLENQIAEFHAQQVVSDRLSEIEREVDDYISRGWMPPVTKMLLFGSFDRESDQIAAFSQVCQANQVDPETELYSMQRVVETFRRCFEGNPIAAFGSSVMEPLDAEEADEADAIWAQAEANHKLRKSRRRA